MIASANNTDCGDAASELLIKLTPDVDTLIVIMTDSSSVISRAEL
ncbi:MAG: hypothetical protein PVG12_01685 [Gammaproteobacteria bacterium]|jgi:hypothetical protein